jgi:hypothetical protein
MLYECNAGGGVGVLIKGKTLQIRIINVIKSMTYI